MHYFYLTFCGGGEKDIQQSLIEEGFVLTSNFRDFSTWSLGSAFLGLEKDNSLHPWEYTVREGIPLTADMEQNQERGKGPQGIVLRNQFQ